MRSLGKYKSSVVGGKSFRTTIPLPAVRALGLEHKDKILWDIIVDDGKIYVTVRKEASQKGATRGARKA